MRSVASRLLAAAICAWAVATAFAQPASAQGRSCAEDDGCVLVTPITGLIDPVIVDYLQDTVASLEGSDGYLGMIVVLDSPGVVVDDRAFAQLVDRLVDAEVPVSVWVGPSGAEATGGAAELVLAIGAKGMATVAPGASIGAVGEQRLPRSRFGDLLEGKTARLATATLDAGKARRAGVVERVDPTLGDHVLAIDGVRFDTVKDSAGRPKRSPTTLGLTQTLPLGSQLFHTAASPAVAYLALAIAIGLLLFEFFTAGVGIAGVIGAGAALMAGYGLGVLPTRPWAVVLCLVAALAFAIDIQTALARLWTVIGLLCWTAGSLFLLDGMRPPWLALAAGVGGMAVAMFSGMPAMVRSRFATPTIGRASLVGREGIAVGAIALEGVVEVDGARWRARTNRATPLEPGELVRVVAIDGLTLEVEPIEGGAQDYRERRRRSAPESDHHDDAVTARDV